MRSPEARERMILLMLYGLLGLAVTYIWLRLPNMDHLPGWHAKMIGGTAAAPNQYRMLTPWIIEALCSAFSVPLQRAYFIERALVTGATLFVFDRYLRTWFSAAASLAGTALLAAAIGFTSLQFGVQEADPINLMVVVLAFLAIARGKDWWLVPLMVLGTLNRETIAMIPAVYLLARWGSLPRKNVVSFTLVLGVLWLVTYGGLRLWFGHRDYYCDVFQLEWNLTATALHPWTPMQSVLMVFGGLWFLPIEGRKFAPPLIRRGLWLVPPFLLLHLVVARVDEARLFLPLATILVPLSLWALLPLERNGRLSDGP